MTYTNSKLLTPDQNFKNAHVQKHHLGTAAHQSILLSGNFTSNYDGQAFPMSDPQTDEASLREKIAENPENIRNWWGLTLHFSELEQPREILLTLLEMHRKWPNRISVIRMLGTQCAMFGAYTHAIKYLNRAVAWKPDDLAYRELGRCYRSMGDDAKAIESFEQALTLREDYDDAMFGLANVIAKTDRPRALALYEQALEIDPEFGIAWCELAHWKFMKTGDFQQAVELLEKAGQCDDADRIRTWALLDICFAQLGEGAKQEKAFQRLNAVAKDDPEEWSASLDWYLEWDQVERAAICAAKIVALDPKCPELQDQEQRIHALRQRLAWETRPKLR